MLSLVNVAKTYRLKNALPVKALDNVSVTFQEKGMIFILGKSGSGKSTMLNIIGGLDFPDSGEIVIKGKSSKDFKGHDYDSYRNTFIGFVFQEYNLLEDFTIGKNIALALELQGKKATPEAIHEILDKVDMAGYENRKINQISGGQKQRVAIARALIKSPEIILADEPTGALDSVTGRQVFEILQKLSKDKLVIVVSHDRETAELYGDRIIEMKDGQIVSDSSKRITTPKELRKGLFVNKNVIHVEEEHPLDAKDLSILRELQEEKGDIILTRNKALVTSYNFGATTKEETKEQAYDASKLALISSKLKNADSLKIGASGLKHKRVRLFFTILLSFISIVFFALTDTLSAFKAVEGHARTLGLNHITSVTINRRYETPKNVFATNYAVNFSKESIAKLRNKFSDFEFSPIVEFNLSYAFDYQTVGGLGAGDQLFRDIVNGSKDRKIYIDPDYFSNSDYTLLAGDLDDNGTDVVITGFMLDAFYRLSFPYYEMNTDYGFYETRYIKPSEFAATRPARAAQLIDKILFVDDDGVEHKVSGVVDIPYESSRFTAETLEGITSDYQKLYNLIDYVSSMNLTSIYYHENALSTLHLSDNIYATEYYVFYNSDYYYNYSPVQLYKPYEGVEDEYQFSSYVPFNIEEDKLFTDRLIKFTSEPLKDNEIILSYHALIDLFDNGIFSLSQPGGLYPQLHVNFKDGTALDFTNIDNLVSWASNATNLQKLKDTFSGENEIIRLANYMKGYDDLQEYKLAGIYFPTTNVKDVPIVNANYFSETLNHTMTVSKEKHQEFPLSNITYLNVDNHSNNLSNSYISLFNYKDGDFILDVSSPYSYFFTGFGALAEGLTIVFIVIGSILAVFSALLMMNFIATSISYKKREIGILRGLGARKLDVVKIFTFESLVIAAINATLAILVTLPAVYLINLQLVKTLETNIVVLAFTLRQLLLVIAIAIASALLASILPVLGIAKKKPIDAINNR